jgi:polyphosphate kinase 2
MKKSDYLIELKRLQTELAHLQAWVVHKKLKLAIVFEGRDAAGKGGAIKAITARLNPRIAKIIALSKPTEKEKTQWYFQRYVQHLPSAGEIALFDRSWYNRAGVEKVMGFCTPEEHQEFLDTCPAVEQMLSRSGIQLVKYWFSVSAQEQEKRFKERLSNPLKHWKFSDIDLVSRQKWHDYSLARDEMFDHTDTDENPWYVVEADDKYAARLNCIRHLLDEVDYERLALRNVTLPPIDNSSPCQRTEKKGRIIKSYY